MRSGICFSGLVVTPNQAEQLSRMSISMSAILASSSWTGLAIPPPVDDAVKISPGAGMFDISNIEMTSPPVSPVDNPTSSATHRRSKRQLSLDEVKERLKTRLNEPLPPHTSERQSDEELFNRTVELAEVCQNLLKIEKLQNRGLIEQNFYIGDIIVELIQHKLNKKNSSEVSEEIKNYSVFLCRTKVAEAKRVYHLCREFRKIRSFRSGFSPMELSQVLNHIKDVCGADRAFWSEA